MAGVGVDELDLKWLPASEHRGFHRDVLSTATRAAQEQAWFLEALEVYQPKRKWVRSPREVLTDLRNDLLPTYRAARDTWLKLAPPHPAHKVIPWRSPELSAPAPVREHLRRLQRDTTKWARDYHLTVKDNPADKADQGKPAEWILDQAAGTLQLWCTHSSLLKPGEVGDPPPRWPCVNPDSQIKSKVPRKTIHINYDPQSSNQEALLRSARNQMDETRRLALACGAGLVDSRFVNRRKFMCFKDADGEEVWIREDVIWLVRSQVCEESKTDIAADYNT